MSDKVDTTGPSGTQKRAKRKPSRLLFDYRVVYREPDAEGGTAMQQRLREMLKKDAGRFMDRYQKLEEAHEAAHQAKRRAARAAVSRQPDKEKPAEVVEDLGEAKCLELIDRLLGEWRAQSRPAV